MKIKILKKENYRGMTEGKYFVDVGFKYFFCFCKKELKSQENKIEYREREREREKAIECRIVIFGFAR